jgi:hypothetical protein
LKPISKIVVGNRKASEYSKVITNSPNNLPLVLSLLGMNFTVDFDYGDNVFIDQLKDISLKAQNLVTELESSKETINGDKVTDALNLIFNFAEKLVLSGKLLNINANVITLAATESLSIGAPNITLGNSEGDDANPEASFVLVLNKFLEIWNAKIDSFRSMMNDLISDYNTHTHPSDGVIKSTAAFDGSSGLQDLKDINQIKGSNSVKAL